MRSFRVHYYYYCFRYGGTRRLPLIAVCILYIGTLYYEVISQTHGAMALLSLIMLRPTEYLCVVDILR